MAGGTDLVWNRQNLLATARLLGALLLAGLAVQSLRSRMILDGILFGAGAVGLFLWGGLRERGPECAPPPWPEERPLSWTRWIAVAAAFLSALLAWPGLADNALSPAGLLWLGGAMALVVWAGWERGRSREETDTPTVPGNDLLGRRARLLALLGIVLLGAVFRLYLLDTLPSDMFNDLAYNYQATERILGGQWMIYDTGFPGREPLLFYLTALLAHVSGLNFYTLKLVTALVGIATVPVVYLLGREMANDAVGLVAALFLAVAKWHVLISRVGFRGILNPLVTALVLLFLVRGLKRGRRSDFLWAGAFLGLAPYTYTAALALVPATLLGLALYALAGHARHLWRLRRSLLLGALVALLVALPMLRYMLLDGRENFWFRPLTRVAETEKALPGPALPLLLGNLVRTAGMFHVQGDIVFRTNVPNDPHLDGLAGALFLLGLPLALLRWRRGANALMLVFFFVLLLPTALALAFPNEVPGAVRAGGALATVMLFPAWALVLVWERLGRLVGALRSPWAWGGLLAALALASGAWNAHLCFVEYPQSLPCGNYPLFREIAHVIDEFGGEGAVLLKDVPFWSDKDAIRLQTQNHHDWGLHGEAIPADQPLNAASLRQQGPLVALIFHPDDRATRSFLQKNFPQGIEILYRDRGGAPQFAVFLFATR